MTTTFDVSSRRTDRNLDLTAEDGRYHRQELITWWDQERLLAAHVLVVGAGALGNEILKNLALLGVGHVHVIDMDRIEHSNLARCVLFREPDEGQPKARVAASVVGALNPDVRVTYDVASVLDKGIGWFSQFDVVIGGLDNREARLWVGRACRALGSPWVDGAIEGLRGLVRVFLAEGSCYECTLGEHDREIIAHRRACTLLSQDEMLSGKVPTNATTAAIVAAVEVQEAVKLVVGRPDLLALRGQAWFFTGDSLESYTLAYGEDRDCLSHDRYERLVEGDVRGETTLRELADDVARDEFFGAWHAIDLRVELVVGRRCPRCGFSDEPTRALPRLAAGDGLCPGCGSQVVLDGRTSFGPDDRAIDVPVLHLGLPDLDTVTVRQDEKRVHLVLGRVADSRAQGSSSG